MADDVCQRFKEHIDAILRGEVAAEGMHDVERHAESCIECRQYLDKVAGNWRTLVNDVILEGRKSATRREPTIRSIALRLEVRNSERVLIGSPSKTLRTLPGPKGSYHVTHWDVQLTYEYFTIDALLSTGEGRQYGVFVFDESASDIEGGGDELPEKGGRLKGKLFLPDGMIARCQITRCSPTDVVVEFPRALEGYTLEGLEFFPRDESVEDVVELAAIDIKKLINTLTEFERAKLLRMSSEALDRDIMDQPHETDMAFAWRFDIPLHEGDTWRLLFRNRVFGLLELERESGAVVVRNAIGLLSQTLRAGERIAIRRAAADSRVAPSAGIRVDFVPGEAECRILVLWAKKKE